MLLTRTLTISNTSYHVVEERVILGLNQSGRASFILEASSDQVSKLSVVAFDIGYAHHDNSERLFLGYVESITVINQKFISIFCRELANQLQVQAPISLRHPTLSDVLATLSSAVKLEFYTHENGAKVPHFYNIGNGYNAMNSIAALFKIGDFIWQQQGNGVIYAGDWSQSRWEDKALDIETVYFEQQLSGKSAVIAAIPAMRPGVLLNGQRIKTLDFSGNKMTLAW